MRSGNFQQRAISSAENRFNKIANRYCIFLLYKTWLNLSKFHHSTKENFRGSASCFYQGSRLLLVHRRKFGSSRAYFFDSEQFSLKLLAIVHPLFSANLTNRGLPFDLFTGLLILNQLWFTNQIVFGLGFGTDLKISESYNAGKLLVVSKYE